MSKYIFDGVEIDTEKNIYVVQVPKWMRRQYGRQIRRCGMPKGKVKRIIMTEPDELLTYREALTLFRRVELFQFSNETEDYDDSECWLCSCGHYIENGLHCTECGGQPPWGCPCSFCEDGDDYDDDYDDEYPWCGEFNDE